MNAYCTAPPANTSAHMAARLLMMPRWYHRLSAWVHTMPPGASARCMASKKGCRGRLAKEGGGKGGVGRAGQRVEERNLTSLLQLSLLPGLLLLPRCSCHPAAAAAAAHPRLSLLPLIQHPNHRWPHQ